jgi:hypothetical protein
MDGRTSPARGGMRAQRRNHVVAPSYQVLRHLELKACRVVLSCTALGGMQGMWCCSVIQGMP